MRVEYRYADLREDRVHADPLTQFDDWFQAAVEARLELPNAMVLATADADGRPAARYVLLKEFGAEGFVFYSHSDSPKGRQLEANPHAALVFYWHPLHRQVRIEGRVEMLAAGKADDYFRSRPRGSQLSVWVARQSSVLDSRESMQRIMAEIERQYPDGPVPRPPHWSGYRVIPERVEFWQGQEDRLHDRLVYSRHEDEWVLQRLAP